jgi:putative heme-binding domain-containing protein
MNRERWLHRQNSQKTLSNEFFGKSLSGSLQSAQAAWLFVDVGNTTTNSASAQGLAIIHYEGYASTSSDESMRESDERGKLRGEPVTHWNTSLKALCAMRAGVVALAACCLAVASGQCLPDEPSQELSKEIARHDVAAFDNSGIGNVVQSAISRGVIPGAVVHVSRAGRPLLFAAYGNSDGDRQMTTDTMFRIASMTKPVTSVAVMMLVEEGKIGLDDPLSRHLPEFADVRVVGSKAGETVAPARAVTIRDLLSHTSGIPYGFNPPDALKALYREAELADGLNRRDPPLADNIRKLARIPLAHQPGTAFTYGLNTDVLGRVIEVSSGMPFDRFLSERIFTPLRMPDTGFFVSSEKQKRLAALYRPVADAKPGRDGKTAIEKIEEDPAIAGEVVYSAGRVQASPKYLSGGAGLVSTAADYARFLTMLLRGGEFDGRRLLRAETIRAMTTNQIGTLDCAYPIHGEKFGLGFGVTAKSGGTATVGSYSWGGIYHTFFWVDPDKELVAVLMTQLFPWGDSTIWADFQKSVYEAIEKPQARLTPDQADEQRRAAMNSAGNTERGKELYVSEALKCATCHKVAGKGGDAGPDLSLVAGKLDRTHLIESLLDPSAQILEGYRTIVVNLKDGRTLSGIVVNETADAFTLIDATNKPTNVDARDVEERVTSPISLMPANLTASLSPPQFTDLIAYLETLHSGRRPSPGEGVTGVVSLPEGFVATLLADGLTGCTAMAVAPDNRVFVCEQTGALRIVKDGRLVAEPFAKLNVTSTWERGLIGVTLHPDFERQPFVYVCYVSGTPYPHHVVSRLTADGDRAVSGSEVVLFEGDDQSKLGGDKPDGHQGGALHFGPDSKLYVAIGDQTAGAPAQRLDSVLGKILRLNADGSIPADNPFYRQSQGKYRAIWALGLRNPFTFAVQPGGGRMFINDVGGRSEEINEGAPGANFGWPANDHGPPADSRFRRPAHYYPTACISGGAFAPADLDWPVPHCGRYFFADFNHGFIRTLDPDRPAEAAPFAGGLRRPVDLHFGPDGTLYALLRNAWVIDGAFRPHTGALVAIRPGKPPAVAVSEETLFGDMECLVISTPAAKYYYGKRGAGFARILDPAGNDWISYRHGGQAAGEYRGLPKLGQPVKYFHCGYGFGQYATNNPFRTSFVQASGEHVRVESETQDGAAACVWDFFPNYAALTLKRIPGGRYWFLYEGTPGGRFDVTNDFSIRPGGKRAALAEAWTDVVPWAAFGAGESPYALLCINHQPHSPGDSFVRWPYTPDAQGQENLMTVFGFGRPGWQSPDQHSPQLTELPARFTIAMTKADSVETLAAQLSNQPGEQVAKSSDPAASAEPVKVERGFVSLFDGKSLGKWDGDPKFWRVEAGAIVGETEADKQPPDNKNTFLIYRGREYADFELRFRYKVEGFNSGMQYRSVDRGQFHVDGLQADFEACWHPDPAGGPPRDRFSGMFFEENGRMFMAQRGEAVIVRKNPVEPKKPNIEKVASLGDEKELEKVIRRDDWNDYIVIADGNSFTHIINGRVQTLAIDEDDANFRKTGILALQLHSGKPMRIDVRDVRIRELPKR